MKLSRVDTNYHNALLLFVFQINMLQSIKELEKDDLKRILGFIENTLQKHWSDHEGFINLQERILALLMILDEAGDKPLDGRYQ